MCLELLNGLEYCKQYHVNDFFQKYGALLNIFGQGNTPLIPHLDSMSRLRDKLIEDVYRQYQFREDKKEEICTTYWPLIDFLFSYNHSHELSIFTTNYDRVIEKLCYKKGIDVIDGFVRNQETDKHDLNPEEYEWYPEEFKRTTSANNKNIIKLYKLHGSLNWRVRFDDILVRIATEEKTTSTNYKNNLVIYPSEKVKPEMKPFNQLHECFVDEIKRADAMVFIGFAFRDEYLNDIIKNTHMRKIIISPHAAETIKKPSGKACNFKRANVIDASFGKTPLMPEIQKILKSIHSEDLFLE